MRMIDADRLFDSIYDNVSAPYEESVAAKKECLREIEDAPTVDAVVVTRCKDCKHRGGVQVPCNGINIDYCKVWDCTLQNLETTFCSYGEKKDGKDG